MPVLVMFFSMRVGVVRATGPVATLLALSVALSAAVGAQSCTAARVAARVDGQNIPLGGKDAQRLPYARPITLLVSIADTARLDTVDVHYALDGSREGRRAGDVGATPASPARACWTAPLPAVHLNEAGTVTVRIWARPARNTVDKTGFAAAILTGLSQLANELSREEFEREAGLLVERASRTAFTNDPSTLVIRPAGGQPVRLIDSMARLLPNRLDIARIPTTVRAPALVIAQRTPLLVTSYPALSTEIQTGCRSGNNFTEIIKAAGDLANASDAAVINAFASGALPWSPCARAMIERARVAALANTNTPQRDADTAMVRFIGQRLDVLETLPAAQLLASVAASIRALTEVAVSVQTIEIDPIAADVLEKYTQADVMGVTLPGRGFVQPFAAVTLYLSKRGEGSDARLVQSFEPRGQERYGLQVGYPVGSPTSEDDDPTYKPSTLFGFLVRLTPAISFSAGDVMGRAGGKTRHDFFFSTNLDLTSLAPLQGLVSRPDR